MVCKELWFLDGFSNSKKVSWACRCHRRRRQRRRRRRRHRRRRRRCRGKIPLLVGLKGVKSKKRKGFKKKVFWLISYFRVKKKKFGYLAGSARVAERPLPSAEAEQVRICFWSWTH